MKFKSPKLIYREIIHWCRTGFSCMNEKRSTLDEDSKNLIRAKRNLNHLPDPWDTQWIKRPKSWKHRVRKRKQWMKHEKSNYELNQYENYEQAKEELLYKLSDHDGWYYISDARCWCNDNYSAAEELVKEGKLEPMYELKTWKFTDFGNIIKRSRCVLIAVRLIK